MILIVDYGLGNILSVSKAFEAAAPNLEVVVSADHNLLAEADRIVLPGVGHFRTGMEHLQERQLIEPLREEVVTRGKPLLGICLGMQILVEVGEEDEVTPGLGFLPGRSRALDAAPLKLPHIGWDDLDIIHSEPLFSNISRSREFYFVHGQVVECPSELVVATCTYGETFPAAIHQGNIYAAQFHPEKSRDHGLQLIRNFVRATGC